VINPSSDIIFDASCTSGCVSTDTLFSFQVFANNGTVKIYMINIKHKQKNIIFGFKIKIENSDYREMNQTERLIFTISLFYYYKNFVLKILIPFLKTQGSNTAFTLKQSLFAAYPKVVSWMVQYSASVSNTTGSSSIILFVAQLPTGGNCTLSPNTGVALSTYFGVTCPGWTSPRGSITSYELNGKVEFRFV
jgi:hypothetical protein